MAGIPLSAKSGSNWMAYELIAFNIWIETANAATFYIKKNACGPFNSYQWITVQGALAKCDQFFFQYTWRGVFHQ